MLIVEPSAGNGAGAYGQSLSIMFIMDIHSQKAGVLFQSAAAGDQPGEGVLSQPLTHSLPTFSSLPRIILQLLFHFIVHVICFVMGTNLVIFHEYAVHGQSGIIHALCFCIVDTLQKTGIAHSLWVWYDRYEEKMVKR